MSTSRPTEEKLQKVLAAVGLASRRVVEGYILDERITVNGGIAHIGQRINRDKDELSFDGVPLRVNPELVYYLLHKPKGVISTANAPPGRKTVTDLVPVEPRVYPVGRLDKDPEGLLLITNDAKIRIRSRQGIVSYLLNRIDSFKETT